MLATLLENNDILLTSSLQILAISDGTAKGVLEAGPGNLFPKRKAVIKAACPLCWQGQLLWAVPVLSHGYTSTPVFQHRKSATEPKGKMHPYFMG